VTVEVGDEQVRVSPNRPVTVEVPESGKVTVRALSAKGELIETFDEELDGVNARYVYNVAGAVPLVEWTAVYTRSALGRNPPKERQLGTLRWSVTDADHVFEEPPERIQVKENSAGYREVLSANWQVSPYSQSQGIKDEKERARVIRTHARWDATDSAHYYEWLALASQEPGFEEIFATRLKEDTSNVSLLRFEQDHAADDQHAQICGRHQASAAAAPSDANWQYLSIRCDSDGPQRDAKFIAAQQKFPDNGWLALAAAATHAQAGNYLAAAPLYEKAYKSVPAMREYLALDAARVRRINLGTDASLRDLAKHSQQLQLYSAIESGEELSGTPLEAYNAIARGQLQRATALASKAGNARSDILWLVAASEGASADMIDKALGLEVPEDADVATMFTMYGLAAREGRDTTLYARRIEAALGDEAAPVLEFLDQVRRGADAQQARQALRAMDLRTQLFTQNAVVLMRGSSAPRGWREQVERGLFVGEREYLGPPVNEQTPRQPERRERNSDDSKSARILSSPTG